MKHVLLYLVIFSPPFAYSAINLSLLKPQSVHTWKDQRDSGVVRQSRDYSCGSASMATILTYHYGENVSESDVLALLARNDAASFTDLKRAAEHYGYEAVGLAANLDHLRRLKVPAILFLKMRGREHFTVFRGINQDRILMADPSWGNKTISIQQFLRYWKTTEEQALYGRLLIVLPKDERRDSSATSLLDTPARTKGMIDFPPSQQRVNARPPL